MVPNCAKHHILLFFLSIFCFFRFCQFLFFLVKLSWQFPWCITEENNVVSTGVVLSLACLLFYYFPFFEISLLSSFLFFHFNSNIELKQNFFTHFLDVYSPSLFCIIFTFIFRKTNLSYPLIRTRTCGIWRAFFSGNSRFEIRPFASLPTYLSLLSCDVLFFAKFVRICLALTYEKYF